MSEYKRLTTKCEVGIGLTETSGNIVNDYEKVGKVFAFPFFCVKSIDKVFTY